MPSDLDDFHFKNRNFICSCGKAYLSYAALFTHIKQKHGGKVSILCHNEQAPGQIIRPRSENKRGRPRKNDKLPSQKELQGESYNGFYDNNNLKNINLVNDLNFNQNFSSFQKSQGQGFRCYQQEKSSPANRIQSKRFQKSFQQQKRTSHMHMNINEEDNDSAQFANPNNQLSSNTLALANIIIGLQQLFKQVNNLQIVKDQFLQKFSSYLDLKQFHSNQLLQKDRKKQQVDAFLLGNIICAFLNFCHQTLEQKSGYQQVVLLIVCLLQHIKQRNNSKYLLQCRKESIHECLPSFFQQYLDKVIIKFKSNFWIFRQNNSFKVLIWFLNWLSVIQLNYVKNHSNQDSVKNQQCLEENQNEEEENFQFQGDFKEEKNQNIQVPNEGQRVDKIQIDFEQKNQDIHQNKSQSQQIREKQSNEAKQNGESLEEDQPNAQDSNRSKAQEEDSQFDQNESDKHIIQFQRLSSEVR